MKTKEQILKEAMSKPYCGETYFDFLDDEEKLLIYKAMEEYASHPMSAEQYTLDNGMGTATVMSAEQYSSGAIHSLGEFPTTKSMSAEPTVQQLRDAAKNNPDTFLAGALYVIDNYKLNSHPMSAEQVEILKLSAHFLNKYGGELSNNTCNDTDSHVRDTINRIGKDKFMKMVMDWGSDDCEDAENYDWIVVKVLAHYIKQLTSTTPSVKADGCEHDCVAKDMYWKQCHKCGMILPIN